VVAPMILLAINMDLAQLGNNLFGGKTLSWHV
jgi:hypothetical protein